MARLGQYANGVYLFYKSSTAGEKLVYIGKATSRSFIERVPAHFDPREEAWFNSLTKAVRVHEELSSYQDALEVALTLHLLLIGVSEPSTGGKLESLLRSFLTPRYNFTRKRYSGSEYFADLLGKRV